MPGMPQAGQATGSQLVAACVASQQQVTVAADAANRRIEFARQTNQPAAMRAAIDDLQGVLSSMRAQLAPCAELQASVAPAAGMADHDMRTMSNAGATAPGTPVMQSGSPAVVPGAVSQAAAPAPQKMANMPGHNMPNAPAATPVAPRTAGSRPPATQAGPATPAPTADPHVGHAMPTPAAAPTAKPAAPAATRSRPVAPPAPATDPHAGHAMPTPATVPAAAPVAPPELDEDPVSKTKVDPKTSLRVLHQGKMYYFRSDKERQEFMRNPGKYVSAK